jgi:hypothetical protein
MKQGTRASEVQAVILFCDKHLDLTVNVVAAAEDQLVKTLVFTVTLIRFSTLVRAIGSAEELRARTSNPA